MARAKAPRRKRLAALLVRRAMRNLLREPTLSPGVGVCEATTAGYSVLAPSQELAVPTGSAFDVAAHITPALAARQLVLMDAITSTIAYQGL